MLFDICTPVRAAMKLPDPVAFSIGDLSIYWFGVLFAAGILLALVFTYLEAKRRRLDPDTWIDLCLVLIPCGIIGARIFFVLGHLSAYQGAFVNVCRIWDGGLSVYGAFLLGLAGLYLYARKKKTPFGTLLDTLAPGIVLAQAVIAWSDFFQQQNYGRLVENPALHWFPFAVLIESSDTIHYAVFFYACLICIAIFLLLWFFFRKRATHRGEVFAWYLTLFFGTRILLELLLDNGVMTLPGLLTNVLLLLTGLILLLVLRRRPPTISFSETRTAECAATVDDAAEAPVVEAPTQTDAPVTIDAAINAAEETDMPQPGQETKAETDTPEPEPEGSQKEETHMPEPEPEAPEGSQKEDTGI